jgi:hypothetical protein
MANIQQTEKIAMLQSLLPRAWAHLHDKRPPAADTQLSFESASLSAIYDYWRAKAPEGRLPGRQDIDPIELGGLLRYVVLVDVEPTPLRFRYRLIGTHSTEMLERDHTGRYIDDAYGPGEPNDTSRAFTRVVRERTPLRLHGASGLAGKRHLQFEAAILPLAADGATVNMLLLGVVYDTQRRATA